MFAINAAMESDFQLLASVFNRRLISIKENFDIEAEGLPVKHIAGQNHLKLNGLGAARWRTFPWDGTILTSVAFGAEIFFSTKTSHFEVERKGKRCKTMACHILELALAMPKKPAWELVTRVRSRSAAFSMFEVNLRGDRHVFGFGFKHRF